ncbi:MAG: preprotein translocase subunit YajC [Chloroflexota bacterium]|nr:preprotein translocase subunit YajC [Chloroflexota bacterium]
MYMILVLVAMFGIFYLLLIRPQRKKQKEQAQLIDELQKGDKVITIGGLYGEIESVSEDAVVLKVEDGSKLKFLRRSIMGKQPEFKPF